MPVRKSVKSRAGRRSSKKSTKRSPRKRVSKVALGGVSLKPYGDKIPFTDVRGFRVGSVPITISTPYLPASGGVFYGLVNSSATVTTTVNFAATSQILDNQSVLLSAPVSGITHDYCSYPLGAGFGIGERLDEMFNYAAITNRWDQYRIDSVDYIINFDGTSTAGGAEGVDLEKVTLYVVQDNDDIIPFTSTALMLERPGYRMHVFDKQNRTWTFSYKPQYQNSQGVGGNIQQQVEGGWFDTLSTSLQFLGLKFYCLYDQPVNTTSASTSASLSQNKVFSIDRINHISVRGYK